MASEDRAPDRSLRGPWSPVNPQVHSWLPRGGGTLPLLPPTARHPLRIALAHAGAPSLSPHWGPGSALAAPGLRTEPTSTHSGGGRLPPGLALGSAQNEVLTRARSRRKRLPPPHGEAARTPKRTCPSKQTPSLPHGNETHGSMLVFGLAAGPGGGFRPGLLRRTHPDRVARGFSSSPAPTSGAAGSR